MKLAGHSSFETTHKFYLSIKKDYLDKARHASLGLGLKLGVGLQGTTSNPMLQLLPTCPQVIFYFRSFQIPAIKAAKMPRGTENRH